MTTRGIFVLENIRIRQREGSWVPTSDVFGRDSLQQVGYVVGGSDSSNNSVSYYQSISYSSDTRSNVANLPQGRAGVYGVASPSNGYAIGGGPGDNSQPNNTYFSSSNRLTFSTQTNSALPGVNLSESYGRGGSTGSSTAGYVAGGFSGPGGEPTGWSRLDKLTYSTETMQRIPGSNIPGRGYGGATGHSQSATANGDLFGIWIAGNIFPSPSSNLTGTQVMRFQFSTDQWDGTVPSWNLSGPGNRLQKAGMTASGDGAYIVGGSYPANTRVQKISFSDMTNSVVTNTAAPGRTDLTATGNPSSGYFAGGATGNNANGTGGSVSSIVEKIDFSTNSISRVPALDLADGLSEVGSMAAAGDNKNLLPIIQTFTGKESSFNFGYSMTGRRSPSWAPGPAMEFTYKVDYGTDTSAASPTAGASYGLEQAFGAGNSTHGYKMGGRSNSVPGDGSETGEKFIYATDTRTNFPNYANRRYGSFMVTNGETALYGTGGRGQPSTQLHSNTYKMSYSTETWSDIPGANDHIDQARKAGAALASLTHGYFAGGGDYPTTERSDVDKMDFSSDTMNKIPSMSLTVGGVDGNRGFSRGDAGYSMGGQTGPGNYLSSMDKITFSTDTTSAFPSNLPDGVRSNQTMSSDSSGYATGGQGPSPSGWDRSTVSKMSYSTGTFSASGNLPTYQNYGIGMSAGSDNLPFQVPPPATPTPSSPAQPLPNLSNDGYNVGGRWNSHPSYGQVSQSWIMKTSYASDTTSLSPNKMIVGRNQFGTFSSASAGYILGGSYEGYPSQEPGTTNIQKITYSTDTASTVPGQLVGDSSRGSGVSNPVTGYYGGGIPSDLGSNIQKYTFSTDTISAQIPDKLGNNTGSPAGLYDMGSAGNTTHGFFLGGDVSGNPSYLRRGTKIEYATDTANASQMFDNLQGARNFAAVGYGNIAAYLSGREGGSSGTANRSLLAKLTYSTDIITTIPSTTFNNSNGDYAGHGSETKGFFAGGGEGTRQYKLTYSTESLSLSPSNSWNFPSSVPGSGGPGAYEFAQGGAFSARNNDGGKVPTPVVF